MPLACYASPWSPRISRYQKYGIGTITYISCFLPFWADAPSSWPALSIDRINLERVTSVVQHWGRSGAAFIESSRSSEQWRRRQQSLTCGRVPSCPPVSAEPIGGPRRRSNCDRPCRLGSSCSNILELLEPSSPLHQYQTTEHNHPPSSHPHKALWPRS